MDVPRSRAGWQLAILWLLIVLLTLHPARAEMTLRVGIGISDQVFKHPTAQSIFEQLLLETILSSLHRPYQIVRAPHGRLQQMLQDGDLELAIRQQVPAAEGIYLTSPYVQIKNKVFASASFKGQLLTAQDLSNFRVTAFQNASHVLGTDYANAVARAPEYRELGDHTQAVLLLLKQRTELLVMNERTLANTLSLLGESGQDLRAFDLFEVTEFRIGSRNAGLIRQIEPLLVQWQQNGELLRLLERGQAEFLQSQTLNDGLRPELNSGQIPPD